MGTSLARSTHGSPTCASCYHHGILERAFNGADSRAELARRARTLCRTDVLRSFGYLHRQRNHGLGHGLMIQTGYDLPTALAICAALPTAWDRPTCSNGVFMENADTRSGSRSRWLDDDDPLYPCGIVSELDRRHCSARVPTQALRDRRGRVRGRGPYVRRPRAALGAALLPRARPRGGRLLVRPGDDARPLRGRRAGRGRAPLRRRSPRARPHARGRSRRRRASARRGSGARSACLAGIESALGLEHATEAARRRACARLTRTYAGARGDRRGRSERRSSRMGVAARYAVWSTSNSS